MEESLTQSLTAFESSYAALELAVKDLMSTLFSTTCGMCTACCCRADICEETLDSAFLSNLLKRQGLGAKDINDRYGWLDLHGCSLEYGKPPVCYAYYCDQLLSRLQDEETRLVARVLGKLMFHVGYQALGERHLVEIMNHDDMEKLDVDILLTRLNESEAAMQVIEDFFDGGQLGKVERACLTAITTEDP